MNKLIVMKGTGGTGKTSLVLALMEKYGYWLSMFEYTHPNGTIYRLKYTVINTPKVKTVVIGNYRTRLMWLKSKGDPQKRNAPEGGWSTTPVKMFLEKVWKKPFSIIMEWANLADTKSTWLDFYIETRKELKYKKRKLVFFCLAPNRKQARKQAISRDGEFVYPEKRWDAKYRAVKRHYQYYKGFRKFGVELVYLGKSYGTLQDNLKKLENVL